MRLTRKEFDELKSRKPHLFDLGQVQPKIAKRQGERALVSESSRRQTRKCGLAHSGPLARVTLTSFRRRELDGDNIVGGFKPLRDAIARWLGCDDSERFITWEYGQVMTKGEVGTVVRIEIL